MMKVMNKPAIKIAPAVASYSIPSMQSLEKKSSAWVKSCIQSVASQELKEQETYMHNRCGDDNASAKLSHSDNKCTIHADRCES
jgi:hypothetical protein